MKRIFIIHGFDSTPTNNWFPWLHKKLEEKGFQVESLKMPNAAHPKREEWVSYLREKIGTPDSDTFLVGHSLGCPAILRYAESLREMEMLGGVLLVAGFVEPLDIEEVKNFVDQPFDYEKIKWFVKHVEAISSDNDPRVPSKNIKLLEENLGAKVTILHNAGHINEKAGYCELPEALEKVVAMAS